MKATHLGEHRFGYWGLFAVGLAIGLVMVWNSQIGGDQSLMLDLGWSFKNGTWLPYGMPTSAGGRSPGGFTGLLVGLPLMLWQDYRSPALSILLLHAGAFLLLAHLLKPILTRAGQWWWLVLAWLGPWHLYFAGHIWNSSYMFVFAVCHLATAQRMARRSDAPVTALHVVLIALAMHAHTSAFVLAILSLLLFVNKQIKVHWGGFAVGAMLSIASFLPWMLAVHHDPSLAPGEKGFFLRGLIFVFPMVRGVLYWLEMSSLSLASRMLDFDFSVALGDNVNTWLRPIVVAIGALAHLTLVPVAWANWRFFKRARHLLRWRHVTPDRPRAWLRRYITLTFIAAMASFAVSPTTTMFWQAFVLLPSTALILIFTIEALLRTRYAARVQIAANIWVTVTLVLVLSQSVAAPLYRCGGRQLGPMNPMLEALHVDGECIKMR